MRDGKIFTGFYHNWRQITKEDQKLVLAERERLGIGGKRGKADGKQQKSEKNWKKTVKGLKKTIAALKRKTSGTEASDDDEIKEEPRDDAGNAFGGRAEKASKRKRNN